MNTYPPSSPAHPNRELGLTEQLQALPAELAAWATHLYQLRVEELGEFLQEFEDEWMVVQRWPFLSLGELWAE